MVVVGCEMGCSFEASREQFVEPSICCGCERVDSLFVEAVMTIASRRS